MADNSLNISIPFKFEIKTPPRGMTDYDPGALTPQQQIELNEYKSNLRKSEYQYLAEHPEIRALVSMIYRMTLNQRPRNIPEYLAELFARPESKLRKDIHKILVERDFEHEGIPEEIHEHWDY